MSSPSSSATETLRLGTRGSALALWQANWVKTEIERRSPGAGVEIVPIKTTGDRIQDQPLAKIGGKGLFTKELDDALLDGRIDLAAHSLKDVPFQLPDGLVLASIPPRELPWDVFISDGRNLRQMPAGASVGTGSLRREVQLKRRFPGLRIVPLRGNVDTRLRKQAAGEFDGIVLAAAGLRRLGYADRITEVLDENTMLPAAGQGALGVVCRDGDTRVLDCVALLEDAESRLAVSAERSLLRALEGTCQVPIAALARVSGSRLSMRALIANLSGTSIIEDQREDLVEGDPERAAGVGAVLADMLMRRGADRILDEIRRHGA
ncbi:MAG TPA: hydroxymethylbilane synthase [Terriglobia bacterium]|nr:hydroxymethylbilane synthase [Terriglobia bacterium]